MEEPRRPIVMKLTRIPGPVNVAGLAALSVPCGFGAGGLTIGLQFIGATRRRCSAWGPPLRAPR